MHMTVRKRKWKTAKGEVKEAWVVDYADNGGRPLETGCVLAKMLASNEQHSTNIASTSTYTFNHF